MEEQSIQDKGSLRSKFKAEICMSSRKSDKSRVWKGILDDEFMVQKIIICSAEQQLFYRHVLTNRRQTCFRMVDDSHLGGSSGVESVVDKIDDQVKTVLSIFSPYVEGNEANKFRNSEQVDVEDRADYIDDILRKVMILLMAGSNYQLYTYQTLLFDQNLEEVVVNAASFVGMSFLLEEKPINIDDFTEIAPILESDTLDKPYSERFNLQLKFRALGVLLLSLILKNKFSVFFRKELFANNENILSIEECRKLLKQAKNSLQSLLTSNVQVVKKIKWIEDQCKLKYLQFLKRVFVEEQKMSWPMAIEMLIGPVQKTDKTLPHSLKTLKIAEQLLRYQKTDGQRWRVLQALGVTEPKIFLFCWLLGEDTHVQYLLGYSDLDDFIFTKRAFNPYNIAIYKSLIRLVMKLFQLLHGENLGLGDRRNVLVKEMKTLQIFQSVKERWCLTRKETGQRLSQELFDYLQKLSSNFGVISTTTQKKLILAKTDKTMTLKKYSNFFK